MHGFLFHSLEIETEQNSPNDVTKIHFSNERLEQIFDDNVWDTNDVTEMSHITICNLGQANKEMIFL